MDGKYFNQNTIAIDEWNYDKNLSDHKGIVRNALLIRKGRRLKNVGYRKESTGF